MSLIFVDKDHLQQIKTLMTEAKGEWEAVRWELEREARRLVTLGPWSVVNHQSPAPSGDPHDIVSQAPYWWPNPADPDGPYIRHDGKTNPQRFDKHRKDLDLMTDTVIRLAAAGHFLDNQAWRDRAMLLVRTWFIDPATRMNPNVKYGEFIKGVCDGRPAGVLLVRQIDRVIHALDYLQDYPEYAADFEGMRAWCREMLEWLMTSDNGRGEAESGNNHAIWWSVHVATMAAFVGDKARLDIAFDHYRNVIVPEQIEPDGGLPHEFERTRSFHYFLFSLDALSLLCEIAHHQGVDLWHYKTADGRGIEGAVRFVVPFLDNPYDWKWPNIDGEVPNEHLSVQLGGLRLNIPECRKANNKVRGVSVWIKSKYERLAPLVLLPGSTLI